MNELILEELFPGYQDTLKDLEYYRNELNFINEKCDYDVSNIYEWDLLDWIIANISKYTVIKVLDLIAEEYNDDIIDDVFDWIDYNLDFLDYYDKNCFFINFDEIVNFLEDSVKFKDFNKFEVVDKLNKNITYIKFVTK